MPYGTVNADVITTSTAGGVLGAGNASIMKNRIINGAMVISQRNGTSSVTPTDGQYVLDRWKQLQAVASKYSVQQNAGSVTLPAGFVNYLGITSLSSYSVGAGEYFLTTQVIEGYNIADLTWGTANAKTVTLSFWVRSSLTGTFGGAVTNGSNTRSYPFTYTISAANTWEYETITIAGDTSGSWATDNTAGIQIKFGLGVGSSLSGTAGAWAGADYASATGATSVVGTNGATFYITGVQLEVGGSATGFEYRLYNQELLACQRYYTRYQPTSASGGNRMGIGSISGSTTVWMQFPVTTMRSTPTATYTSGIQISDSSSAVAYSSITNYTAPISGNIISMDVVCSGASFTVGRGANTRFNAPTDYIDFSAEL